MNYGNICKIDHPFTRIAVIADANNPRLRAAFPECYKGKSRPIPWSVIKDMVQHKKLSGNMITAEHLLDQGIPVMEFLHPTQNPDDGDPFLSAVNLIWKMRSGAIINIRGDKFVVIVAYEEAFAIVIPRSVVDMRK